MSTKLGRKTKLTPELQEKLVSIIMDGNYISTACQACGIDKSQFYRWLQKGDKEGKGIYYDFCSAIKKAEAEAEATLVRIVKGAAPKNWSAAMAILERRYPDSWSQVRRGTVNIDVTAMERSL